MKKINKIIVCLCVMICGCFFDGTDAEAATFYLGEYYFLQSAIDSTMVVDVCGGSNRNGANIQLYKKNGTDAQLFRIARNGNGYYTFINKGSNKAMDVYGAYNYSGANVSLWDQNSSCAQQWVLYTATGYPDGYIRIKNRCGKYLDVNGAVAQNGTNIQIWERNNTNAQVFKLVPYVQTSYKTITLGSFNTIDQWKKQMQYAEQKAVGFSKFSYNLNGEMVNNGKMIIGRTILSYKTISTVYYECGVRKTLKVKLPYKVKFKLHKHEFSTNVWVDFTNVNVTQSCSCGVSSRYQWEIPYPVEDTVTKQDERRY